MGHALGGPQALLDNTTFVRSAPGATRVDAAGGNSMGSSGASPLRGLSTGAEAKMYSSCPGCPYKHYSQF